MPHFNHEEFLAVAAYEHLLGHIMLCNDSSCNDILCFTCGLVLGLVRTLLRVHNAFSIIVNVN